MSYVTGVAVNPIEAPPNEINQRLMRARQRMRDANIDALLLFTGPNLSYFTLLPGGRSGSRPYVYLLPRAGEPILIVHSGRQFEAHAQGRVTDIRTYAALSALPLEVVIGALTDRNVQAHRIGVELGGEMALDLPFAEFMRLQAALPAVTWIDASPLLWALRQVKSAYEVACITRACRITNEAYARTFAALRIGLSEVEIERSMIGHLLDLGGEAPWVLITSGTGNYDMVSKHGSARTITAGDMIWMDGGCAVNGYFSDFSRAAIVGEPSAAQRTAQQIINTITAQAAALCRAGTPVVQIAAFCTRAVAEAVETAGVPITSDIAALAGRAGHGLGLLITELPSLNETDQTILQPGMVVTIEPGFATAYGTFHAEENVLVTDAAPRLLSRA